MEKVVIKVRHTYRPIGRFDQSWLQCSGLLKTSLSLGGDLQQKFRVLHLRHRGHLGIAGLCVVSPSSLPGILHFLSALQDHRCLYMKLCPAPLVLPQSQLQGTRQLKERTPQTKRRGVLYTGTRRQEPCG